MGRGYKKYIKPYVRSALEMEGDVDSSEACKFISGMELNACCIKYIMEAKYSDGLACTKLCVSTCSGTQDQSFMMKYCWWQY